MEARTLDSLSITWEEDDNILYKSALSKLIKHGLINGLPDKLGFYTLGKLPQPFPLPYPNLCFERIPFRDDIEAYLLYLGFNDYQAKIILNNCKTKAKKPFAINTKMLINYGNEYLDEYSKTQWWFISLDKRLLSEVDLLIEEGTPEIMDRYLSSQTRKENKRTYSDLDMIDYVKEVMWQRFTNLNQFIEILNNYFN